MTLTVTAAPGFLDVPAVQVSVSSSPALTAPLVLWRVHEDGTRWRVLTEANANVITTWTGFDFHAPFNQMITYTAEAGGLSGSSAATMLISDAGTWLIHASDPDLSVLVDKVIGPAAPYKYPSVTQSFRPLGSKLPVQRHDFPRGGESGQITIKCEDEASRAAVKACLADNGVTLINTPHTDDDIGWKWVQIDDTDLSNPGGTFGFPFRYFALPYREVRQPDVDAGLWTLGESKAESVTLYPTLGAAKAKFATLGAAKLRIYS
jgi:hypothetical protein